MQLTERDIEIVEMLTHQLRVLAVQQIAETWWPDAKNATRLADSRIRKLQEAGWLERHIGLSHPLLKLSAPIFSWTLGDPDPNFGAISYRLKKRWTKPPVETPFVIATKAAADQWVGYGGRLPRRTETTHDLHMAAVFLLMREQRPELVETWVSEAELASRHPGKWKTDKYEQKVPDAMVATDDGPIVIDFGGSYSAEKLRVFHEYAPPEIIGYEIW